MAKPIVSSPSGRVAAAGASFEIHEWSGGGPDEMHLHHADDEAWHILEGTLTSSLRGQRGRGHRPARRFSSPQARPTRTSRRTDAHATSS